MKKQFFILLTLLSLLTTSMQYTMQSAATKTTVPLIKKLAKKTFSSAMTGLHWIIAAGIPIVSGINKIKMLYNEKKTFENYRDADPEITNFIISTLEKTGYADIDAVKIKGRYNTTGSPMGTSSKHILLSNETNNEIKEALINNNQQILYKWIGTLEHENSHRKHNDLRWNAITDLILPFVTHGSVKVIRNIIPIAKKTRSFLSEQFIKIPTAMGKDFITANCRMALVRQQEQRADNEVSNDIHKLIGLKTVLEEAEEKRNHTLFPLSAPQIRKPLLWVNNWLETHPLPHVRIKKLNKRIALLEKQLEQDKSNDS